MYGNGFYNPFMYQTSNMANGMSSVARGGLSRAMSGASGASGLGGLRNLLGKFSFSGFLNGASKTLNVVNQAIPVYYQIKPLFQNAKTMFRIMGAVKDDGKTTIKNTSNKVIEKTKTNTINNQTIKKEEPTYNNSNNPTFFI